MSDPRTCSHGRTVAQVCPICELRGLRYITAPGSRYEAHDLVEARQQLVGCIAEIDARLRELDGRNTAGAPSLRADRIEER